jgi:hypothetical protein
MEKRMKKTMSKPRKIIQFVITLLLKCIEIPLMILGVCLVLALVVGIIWIAGELLGGVMDLFLQNQLAQLIGAIFIVFMFIGIICYDELKLLWKANWEFVGRQLDKLEKNEYEDKK